MSDAYASGWTLPGRRVRERERRLTPALAGSLAFHGGVILLGWLATQLWRAPPPPVVHTVPVSIVAEAPGPEVRAPRVAAEPEPAQAPEPTPEPAPEAAPPPAAEPTPEPPAPAKPPQPRAEPRPLPPPPQPAPSRPRPEPPPPKPKPAPPEPARKPTPAKPAPRAKPPPPAPAPAPEPQPTRRPAPVKPTPKAEVAPPQPAPPRPAPPRAAPPKPEPPPKTKPTAQAKATPSLDLDALSKSLPSSKTARAKAVDLSALASSLPKGRAKASVDLSALASSLPNGKARKSLDLAALAADLPPGRRAAASRGETRAAAAPAAGPKALSPDALGALRAKLNRLWNPNCGVDGASSVVVRVEMRLSPDGQLAGSPRVVSKTGEASSSVIDVAADRAVAAAARGEPYTELPRDAYESWKDIVVRFNAKEACAGR